MSMLGRPWFLRVWTFQELILSKEPRVQGKLAPAFTTKPPQSGSKIAERSAPEDVVFKSDFLSS